jgi:hypothetical protein
MRHKLLGLLIVSILATGLFADDVLLTTDPDDVEHCTALGPVKAKSGWGGTSGAKKGMESVRATLRKRAAALGADVVLLEELGTTFGTAGNGTAYKCSEEAIAKQKEKAAEIARKAAATITCTTGTDCEVRWARVTQWLQDHSQWKFRNVTDTLITTEGPLETAKPAFEVTKMPAGRPIASPCVGSAAANTTVPRPSSRCARIFTTRLPPRSKQRRRPYWLSSRKNFLPCRFPLRSPDG